MAEHDNPGGVGPYHVVESMAGTPLVMSDRTAKARVRIACKTRALAEETCRRLNAEEPGRPLPARERVTVRRMMQAVALVAAMMGAVRLVAELRYATLGNGWNTSVFPTGQRVTTSQRFTAIGGKTLEAGTRGVVISDLTDDDSAYPGRLITVRIDEGQHRGTTQNIERRFLRSVID